VKKVDRPEKLELEDVGLENSLRDWKRGLRELRD
jgi:exonuclease VII small subunit